MQWFFAMWLHETDMLKSVYFLLKQLATHTITFLFWGVAYLVLRRLCWSFHLLLSSLKAYLWLIKRYSSVANHNDSVGFHQTPQVSSQQPCTRSAEVQEKTLHADHLGKSNSSKPADETVWGSTGYHDWIFMVPRPLPRYLYRVPSTAHHSMTRLEVLFCLWSFWINSNETSNMRCYMRCWPRRTGCEKKPLNLLAKR